MVKSATSPSHGHAAYETVKHSKCTELCPVKLMVWKHRPEWTNIYQPTTRDGWWVDREHFSIRFQITMVVISAAVFTTYLLTNPPALGLCTNHLHINSVWVHPLHNCVITGYQWMVHWWLLVCSGPLVIVSVVLEQCRMCNCSII
jgi:hypothetical protein